MLITLCSFSLLTSFITSFFHILQFTTTLLVENVITEVQYSRGAESIAFSGIVVWQRERNSKEIVFTSDA